MIKINNEGHRLSLFLILILFLWSCNNKTYVTVDKTIFTDSLYINKNTNYTSSVCYDFLIENDTAFELILWRNSYYCDSVITVYDIKNNKVAYTIPLPFNNILQVFSPIFFKAYSLDSIFVIFDGNHIGYDSSMVLINRKGKIKKVFNVNNEYIRTTNNSNPKTILFPKIYAREVYENNKVCFSLRRYTTYNDSLLPVVGYYDIKNEKMVVCKNLNLKEDNYYCSFIDTNIICISPSKSSIVYIWNISNNKIFKKDFKSKLVDNSLLTKNIPFYNKEYESLIYLEVNKHLRTNYLVRLIVLPKNVFEKYTLIQVIYDKNYNYIGEVLINDKNYNCILENSISKNIKPWNEYYFIPSENNDKLKLVKIKYILKKWDIIEAKKKLNTSLLNYIKQKNNEAVCFIGNHKILPPNDKNKIFDYIRNKLSINDSTFSLITIRTDGCYHCNEYLYDFILKNKFIFEMNYHAYVLLYDAYKDNNNLTIKNFKSLNCKNILFENVIYPQIHPFSENNPRLVLVKNNKIVSDTIYMPDNLDLLIERLLKFYNFEAK